MAMYSLLLMITASIVFTYIQTGHGAEMEREKRDDDVWTVTTILAEPFVMRKKHPATKNEDFEGYIPDMLMRIFEKLNKKYRIKEVQDMKYGYFDELRGTWSGMIGEVKSGKAEMAAAGLTINAARREVVDFTIPFMTYGTTILMKKPVRGSNFSHTTLQDLLNLPSLRFGVINGGSTEQLIRSSSNVDLDRLQERLDRVATTEEGVARVRSGTFAFVTEQSTANFVLDRMPCDLFAVRLPHLGLRDYGLALRKGSPYTEKINQILREMKQNGELVKLDLKWWTGDCNGASKMMSGVVALTLVLLNAIGRYFVF